MTQVNFTSNLERHLSCPEVETEGKTVRAVLDGVFAVNPRLRGYVLDDQGRLRKHVNIFVNEEAVAGRIGLSDRVGRQDRVFVIQALSGG